MPCERPEEPEVRPYTFTSLPQKSTETHASCKPGRTTNPHRIKPKGSATMELINKQKGTPVSSSNGCLLG